MRLIFIAATVILMGCAKTNSDEIRECAEASALEAEIGREYSRILERSDPALGKIHLKQADTALRAATQWREQACRDL